jgi:hypothetical protein
MRCYFISGNLAANFAQTLQIQKALWCLGEIRGKMGCVRYLAGCLLEHKKRATIFQSSPNGLRFI